MDDTRKYLKLVCEICGEEYEQQERVFKKAKWKNRCRKHRENYERSLSVKINTCVDCGVQIDKDAVRCKKCSGIKRRIYDHDNVCVDCGVPIHHKSIRCLKCHNIHQDKGKSKERTKFNASKKWKAVRTEAFVRDDYTCQICGNRGVELNGHHVKLYKDFEKGRLDIDNIVTLCVECHMKLHHNIEFKNKHKHLICEK